MKTNKLTLTSLIATLISCTRYVPPGPIPESVPETASRPSPTTPAKSQTTEWTFSPYHNFSRYRSITETIIRSTNDSSTQTDSIRITSNFTLDVNHLATSTNVSGEITTIATNTISAFDVPLVFSATITSGYFKLQPALPQSDDEECNTGISQSLGEIRSAINSLPMQVNSSTTWSDSTSTSTCSGKQLPTTLEILRSYRVVGEGHYNGQPVLLLNREDQIRLRGQGAQQQHQLQLQGNGTATSKIILDTQTGTLIATETIQHLQATITASGQIQRFTQTTHQQIQVLH